MLKELLCFIGLAAIVLTLFHGVGVWINADTESPENMARVMAELNANQSLGGSQ